MLSDTERAQQSAQCLLDNDTASHWLGMRLDTVGAGNAVLSMTVTENMLNGVSTCHGGLIFSLADSAFAVACNSYNQVAVASSATIDFLAPANLEDHLIATATVRSQGGRMGLYDVTVANQHDITIALFRGRAYRLGKTLFDEPEN